MFASYHVFGFFKGKFFASIRSTIAFASWTPKKVGSAAETLQNRQSLA